jgi:Acetyltransferase (GNAT) domain
VLYHLQQHEIDKTKWDNCIFNATNTLIYAQAFYLDNCTNKTWGALVLNDYEAVMPITYRKKYGITYLYQPAFLQQAGIFSANKIDKNTCTIFFEALLEKFKFVEIHLNFGNGFIDFLPIDFKLRNNFILNLNDTYENISFSYKSNFTKNIKRASKHSFTYNETDDYKKLISLYKKLYVARFESVKESDYNALIKNCKILQETNNLILRTVTIDNEILAAIILLKDKNRLYNIASSVTDEGKKIRANYFLFDKVIAEFAEQNLILDLEGSNVKGIADFYQSMNPINEPYFALKYNNLPKLIKLFKR